MLSSPEVVFQNGMRRILQSDQTLALVQGVTLIPGIGNFSSSSEHTTTGSGALVRRRASGNVAISHGKDQGRAAFAAGMHTRMQGHGSSARGSFSADASCIWEGQNGVGAKASSSVYASVSRELSAPKAYVTGGFRSDSENWDILSSEAAGVRSSASFSAVGNNLEAAFNLRAFSKMPGLENASTWMNSFVRTSPDHKCAEMSGGIRGRIDMRDLALTICRLAESSADGSWAMPCDAFQAMNGMIAENSQAFWHFYAKKSALGLVASASAHAKADLRITDFFNMLCNLLNVLRGSNAHCPSNHFDTNLEIDNASPWFRAHVNTVADGNPLLSFAAGIPKQQNGYEKMSMWVSAPFWDIGGTSCEGYKATRFHSLPWDATRMCWYDMSCDRNPSLANLLLCGADWWDVGKPSCGYRCIRHRDVEVMKIQIRAEVEANVQRNGDVEFLAKWDAQTFFKGPLKTLFPFLAPTSAGQNRIRMGAGSTATSTVDIVLKTGLTDISFNILGQTITIPIPCFFKQVKLRVTVPGLHMSWSTDCSVSNEHWQPSFHFLPTCTKDAGENVQDLELQNENFYTLPAGTTCPDSDKIRSQHLCSMAARSLGLPTDLAQGRGNWTGVSDTIPQFCSFAFDLMGGQDVTKSGYVREGTDSTTFELNSDGFDLSLATGLHFNKVSDSARRRRRRLDHQVRSEAIRVRASSIEHIATSNKLCPVCVSSIPSNEPKCSSFPSVQNGIFVSAVGASGGGGGLADGTELDQFGSIACDDGYSIDLDVDIQCRCVTDGGACEEIQDVCIFLRDAWLLKCPDEVITCQSHPECSQEMARMGSSTNADGSRNFSTQEGVALDACLTAEYVWRVEAWPPCNVARKQCGVIPAVTRHVYGCEMRPIAKYGLAGANKIVLDGMCIDAGQAYPEVSRSCPAVPVGAHCDDGFNLTANDRCTAEDEVNCAGLCIAGYTNEQEYSVQWYDNSSNPEYHGKWFKSHKDAANYLKNISHLPSRLYDEDGSVLQTIQYSALTDEQWERMRKWRAPCTQCQPGFYKGSNSTGPCIACPHGSTSPAGATSVFACVCKEGFWRSKFDLATGAPTSVSCVPCTTAGCAAGEYRGACEAEADAPCLPCPMHSTSPPGSLALINCTCSPGATGNDGGPCILCAAGKFKTGAGKAPCEDCGLNKYSTVVGSASESLCLNCEAGKKSAMGSYDQSHCLDVCPAGQTGPAGFCLPCPAGTFKSSTGSGSCATCPVNSNSSLGSSLCTCIVGYTGPDGSLCTACAPGTFKDQPGSATCTTCPEYSDSLSASSSRRACKCNSGATGSDGGPCHPCEAGKFKTQPGNAWCTSCMSGKYSDIPGATAASSCNLCPPRSDSPSGSGRVSACRCNVGATGIDGGPCSACAAGKYKSFSGSGACINCPTGTYSTTMGALAFSTCTSCPDRSNSPSGSDSRSNCKCVAGATGNDGAACNPCNAGKFKAGDGSAPCSSCGFGKYSTVVGSASESLCLNCEAGKKSAMGSDDPSDCLDLCPPGMTGPVGSCSPCPAGTFKSSSGSGSCNTCPDNTDSSSGSSLCACNVGYTGADGGLCSVCAAGKFKDQPGSAACSNCSTGQYSVQRGSTNFDDCEQCDAGMYSDFEGATVCTKCAAGKWSSMTGATICTSCPSGKYAASPGNTEESSCLLCPPGTHSTTTAARSATSCSDCEAGKFGPQAGWDAACYLCPVHTSSPVRSTSLESCQCNPGFSLDDTGMHCTGCSEGKFKEGTGNAECSSCPIDYYSPPLSKTSSDCHPAPTVVFVLAMAGDISTSQITDDMQSAMISSIADTLGLSPNLLRIVSITDARRRMLAVTVNVEAIVASEETAFVVANKTAEVAAVVVSSVAQEGGLATTVQAISSVRPAPTPWWWQPTSQAFAHCEMLLSWPQIVDSDSSIVKSGGLGICPLHIRAP